MRSRRGAFDMAMAIGVEKLKDSGYLGPGGHRSAQRRHAGSMTPPASFSLLAPAYFKKYGLDPDKGKDVLSRIAWKNHRNGARNPKAQFQKEVPIESIKNSPKIADPLGIMDCSGVSDGSAAAIVVRAEDAHKYCKNPIFIKALSFVAGPGEGPLSQDYDFTTFPEVVASATRRLRTGRHHQSARADQHGRGARLLHPDRAGAVRRPRLQPARHGMAGRDGRLLRPRRASSRSIPTAGSSRSAIRSAPRACA